MPFVQIFAYIQLNTQFISKMSDIEFEMHFAMKFNVTRPKYVLFFLIFFFIVRYSGGGMCNLLTRFIHFECMELHVSNSKLEK